MCVVSGSVCGKHTQRGVIIRHSWVRVLTNYLTYGGELALDLNITLFVVPTMLTRLLLLQERILCTHNPCHPGWLEVCLLAHCMPAVAASSIYCLLLLLRNIENAPSIQDHAVMCRRCSIVTSAFHMPRSRAIFERCFALAGGSLCGDCSHFQLDYHAVHDDGAFPADVLAARRQREAQSLKVLTCQTFQGKTTPATYILL